MRRVPIFDSVLAVLKEMRLARGTNVLLWAGRKGGQAAEPARGAQAVQERDRTRRVAQRDAAPRSSTLVRKPVSDRRRRIFKLSKILGHATVTITERTYAHLKPDVYEADYGRVAFRMPTTGNVVEFLTAR